MDLSSPPHVTLFTLVDREQKPPTLKSSRHVMNSIVNSDENNKQLYLTFLEIESHCLFENSKSTKTNQTNTKRWHDLHPPMMKKKLHLFCSIVGWEVQSPISLAWCWVYQHPCQTCGTRSACNSCHYVKKVGKSYYSCELTHCFFLERMSRCTCRIPLSSLKSRISQNNC